MCGILYIYIYHIFVVYISDTFFLQGPHELSASRWRWTNHPQQRMQCLWLLSQKKLDWYCAYLCINTVSGCFIMCSWNCNGRKLDKSLKTPSDSSCLKRSIQPIWWFLKLLDLHCLLQEKHDPYRYTIYLYSAALQVGNVHSSSLILQRICCIQICIIRCRTRWRAPS